MEEPDEIDFSRETSFGRFFETPSRETSIPKIPEIDFFQMLGSICFRLSEVAIANRVLEDGPILDSRPGKTCHA